MNEKIKKILAIGVPILLFTALIISSFWGFGQKALADTYRESTRASYKRAFIELSENLDEMEATLSKLAVAGSKYQTALLLDDIWRLSGASVTVMAQIPSSHIDTYELNSFVVRCGDYARELMKSVISGKMPSERDVEQLAQLHNVCIKLRDDVSAKIASESIPSEPITNEEYFTASQAPKDNDSELKFPTLIYDGAFSESNERAEARGLTGSDVSADEALQKALEYAQGATLSLAGESNGSIPAYDFSGTTSAGMDIDVSVTKTGGKLLWLMSSSSGGESQRPDEDGAAKLRDAGLEYLSAHGYGSMTSTYAQYYAGCVLINYAAMQDDVILYSDLVKLWIDIDTGEIIGVDARNYLFSHIVRDLPEPEISEGEAREMVSKNLSVESIKLAYIPLTIQTERLCYEFKGKCGEQSYIIYIDAVSGEECEIFKIIDSDQGQLVI